MAHCTYNFPSKCGTNYLWQTGKPLPMHCLKHTLNLKQGYFGKPMLVQHPYESLRYTAMQPRPFTQTPIQETYGISKYGMIRKCRQSSLGFCHVQIPLIVRKWINDWEWFWLRGCNEVNNQCAVAKDKLWSWNTATQTTTPTPSKPVQLSQLEHLKISTCEQSREGRYLHWHMINMRYQTLS